MDEQKSSAVVLAGCLVVVFGFFSIITSIAVGLFFGAGYGFATLAAFALLLCADLYAGYRRAKKKL